MLEIQDYQEKAHILKSRIIYFILIILFIEFLILIFPRIDNWLIYTFKRNKSPKT